MRVGILLVVVSATGSASGQELVRELVGSTHGEYFGERLVALDDVNGDGVRDLLIVASNFGTSHQSGFVRGVSGRTGATLYEVRSSSQVRYFPLGVALFDDDDGDGVRDFLVSGEPGVGLGVHSGRTGRLLRSLVPSRYYTPAAIGDVDGDGRSDVAIAGNGPEVISGRSGALLWQVPMGPGRAVFVPLGDVTGDGWPDFTIASFVGTSHVVAVLSPRERCIVWSLSYSTSGPVLVSPIPDQDNDGRLDLAFGANDTVEVLSSRGARIRTLNFGMRPWALGLVGDIDGDGFDDLGVGEDWSPSRANILSTRNWSTIYSFDTSPLQAPSTFAALGDVNGDGRNDFAVGFPAFSIGSQYSVGCVRFYGPVPADYREFGSGCPGTAGVPRLSALGPPRVGEPFEVRIAPVPPLSFTVLLLGASNTTWGGLALPVDLGLIGMPTCTLLASGEASAALFSTTGSTGWSTTIPADYTLLRARFYNQAFPFDPRANALGVIATNAGEGYIGG